MPRGHYKGMGVKAALLAVDRLVLGLASAACGPRTGELRVVSTKDGAEVGRVELGAGVIQAGLAARGRLYVTCDDAVVRCFGG